MALAQLTASSFRSDEDPVSLATMPQDGPQQDRETHARTVYLKAAHTVMTALVEGLITEESSARALFQIGAFSRVAARGLRTLGGYDFSEHRRLRGKAYASLGPSDAETVGATVMKEGMAAMATSQRARQIADLSAAIKDLQGLPGMESQVQALRDELALLVAHHPTPPVPSDSLLTPSIFEEAK